MQRCDYLADEKILVMPDDAAGYEQARSLLPGTGGSFMLLTRRPKPTALEDAAVISLDTLTPGEAAELLAHLGGPVCSRCAAIWLSRRSRRPGTSEEAAEIKRLRAENAELRRANEILKAASAFFAAELDRPSRFS